MQFGGGERMQKISNLYSLYELGHLVGQLTASLNRPQVRFGDIAVGCGNVWALLNRLVLTDAPVPLDSTGRIMKKIVAVFDSMKGKYGDTPSNTWTVVFFGTIEHQQLKDLIIQLEVQLMNELDSMPIWFVTKRRAYSIEMLINNAEEALEASEVPLLSSTTVYDIRQAGKAIAFDLPTAVGFHAVRAVEGVARGYHEIIIGRRPNEGDPLGPLINNLRAERDTQLASKQIDKEDLLNIAIDLLARFNNVYRKPVAHPDMVLKSDAALNVFDSAKCAIELMLEDSRRKRPTIPAGFF